ncbi:hypothetical protein [Streptomyces sp. SBT349]|uniref:hypothetical protein n=1 Tax=Streptomyces sp. SBT349 TaxID=1580539 RepID=UPI00131C7047|nr:hypothetical protein [Streptomyces sp. SBT349]
MGRLVIPATGRAGVLVSVEIDAGSVRRGDQVMIGGWPFTVRDIVALPHGRKRLDFGDGESLIMGRRTVLWAARLRNPRIR